MEREGFVLRDPDPSWGSDEDEGLHLVLVEPEIPGNTGNIGRLCAGSNVWLHLIEPLGFELDNKYLRRAGLDYWPHVSLTTHPDFETFTSYFERDSMHLFTKKAEVIHTDVRYRPGAVLVFGCETRGLPDAILASHEDRLVRIPISTKVRSLNLSNACAIATYEAMRQLAWTPLTVG